jgi:hypothetical protein
MTYLPPRMVTWWPSSLPAVDAIGLQWSVTCRAMHPAIDPASMRRALLCSFKLLLVSILVSSPNFRCGEYVCGYACAHLPLARLWALSGGETDLSIQHWRHVMECQRKVDERLRVC